MAGLDETRYPEGDTRARLWVRHETLLTRADAHRLESFARATDRKLGPAIRYAVRRMLDEWEQTR